jgi:uncharacterized phage protein (TIGR01671 family)
MNRKIKFRAFCKSKKKIIQVFGLNQNLVFEQIFEPPCIKENTYEIEDFILMQYAGFQDKNKKDVYDGDVLKTKDNIGFVSFDCQYLQWFILHNDGVSESLDISFGNHAVVIGNIHENPELLIDNKN